MGLDLDTLWTGLRTELQTLRNTIVTRGYHRAANGPHLRGNSVAVGIARGEQVYEGRGHPTVVTFYADATGTAGDRLFVGRDSGSLRNAYQMSLQVGEHGSDLCVLHVIADPDEDLFAVATLAAGGTIQVRVVEGRV